MYYWRIADGESGRPDTEYRIVWAPSAEDALTMFRLNVPQHPAHIECLGSSGPFAVWDKERCDWVRGPFGVIVLYGDFRVPCLDQQSADKAIELVKAHEQVQYLNPGDHWVARSFQEEM